MSTYKWSFVLAPVAVLATACTAEVNEESSSSADAIREGDPVACYRRVATAKTPTLISVHASGRPGDNVCEVTGLVVKADRTATIRGSIARQVSGYTSSETGGYGSAPRGSGYGSSSGGYGMSSEAIECPTPNVRFMICP